MYTSKEIEKAIANFDFSTLQFFPGGYLNRIFFDLRTGELDAWDPVVDIRTAEQQNPKVIWVGDLSEAQAKKGEKPKLYGFTTGRIEIRLGEMV